MEVCAAVARGNTVVRKLVEIILERAPATGKPLTHLALGAHHQFATKRRRRVRGVF